MIEKTLRELNYETALRMTFIVEKAADVKFSEIPAEKIKAMIEVYVKLFRDTVEAAVKDDWVGIIQDGIYLPKRDVPSFAGWARQLDNIESQV